MKRSVRLLAVAAAVAAVACSGDDGRPLLTDAPAGRSPQPAQPPSRIGEPQEFVPPIHKEEGKTVLPVVFPDGTIAELVYPPSLRIAQMGLRPYRAGGFGRPPMRDTRDFAIFYQGVPRVWLAGRAPLARYDTPKGPAAEYWDTTDSWDPGGTLGHLILRVGPWYVAVWDRGVPNDERNEAWAEGLLGTETKDGFLVLRARAPLRLTRAGEKAGPQLIFEGGDPNRRIKNRPMLLLFPNRCDDYSGPSSGFDNVQIINGRGVSRSPGFADSCFESEHMVVHAYGPHRFVDSVVRHLEVRNVELGP